MSASVTGLPPSAGAQPKPDTSAAVEFLHRWSPDGSWVLTAIHPERGGIETRTFPAGGAEALHAWIDRWNGTRNVYFHVNPTTRDLTTKARREDIAELAWLHVDIDPRPGEALADERARALGLLTDNLPVGVPPPTAVIFSGGGYQAFWRLADPFPINGELAKADEAKLWNLRLERLFGADNCHNVDRIMRLPGTINLPDEGKRKKGRVPMLAELVEFHDDRTYSLDEFTSATVPTSSAGNPRVQIDPGSIRRLDDVDELDKWKVCARVKVIIARGRHPNEGPKQRDDSRSAWLFDAVCGLVRCEVPDEVIYSVITDPDFLISASVLDKGSEVEKYAMRQINAAREHAIDPHLKELNDQFFVVEDEGSQCRVAFFRNVPLGHGRSRDMLVTQSFTDFRNRFMNRSVEIPAGDNKVVRVSLGKWWLEHERRRQYRQIVFLPEGETPDGVFNLWRGFAVDPRRGSWQRMARHIFVVLADRDPDAFRYIIRWAAWAVQNPAEQAEVALAFRGGRGTGKGTFGRAMRDLFGQHGLQISRGGHLTGRFNAHLRDCCLLFADEAVAPDDREAESALKALLTEPTVTIEPKGKDLIEEPNHLHVVMASNDEWVVPAGPDERRFAVFDVSDGRRGNKAWFESINNEWRNGGAEAMLDALLRVELGDWHPRLVPRNPGLAQQKLLSLLRKSPLDALLFDWLWTEEFPPELDSASAAIGRKAVNASRIVDWLRERRRHNMSAKAVTERLKRLFGADGGAVPEVSTVLKSDRSGGVRTWVLPRLEDARRLWEHHVAPLDSEWGCGDLPPLDDSEDDVPF